MEFELQGHIFDYKDRSLTLVRWPSGATTSRIVQGLSLDIEAAKQLAASLLECHRNDPDAYQIPEKERSFLVEDFTSERLGLISVLRCSHRAEGFAHAR